MTRNMSSCKKKEEAVGYSRAALNTNCSGGRPTNALIIPNISGPARSTKPFGGPMELSENKI